MIGIIGAMEEEVAELKDKMTNSFVETHAGMDFVKGWLCGHEVVIVRSGIGKVSAGACAQILADVYGADAIINTGIAGSLKAEIDIGDIVVSTDALQHDVDARAFGYPQGQIPRMDTLSWQADEHMVNVAESCCREVNPDIHVYKGRIVSGDQFISDQKVKDNITELFGGYCTEMEGAAIAQVAYMNHIPFVIIRAISDKADGSAHMDYPAFEKKAIEHVVRLTESLLTAL